MATIPLLYETLDKSYPKRNCNETTCDWYDDCERVKWIWFQEVNDISVNNKLSDYCKMKTAINSALYNAIMDLNCKEII